MIAKWSGALAAASAPSVCGVRLGQRAVGDTTYCGLIMRNGTRKPGVLLATSLLLALQIACRFALSHAGHSAPVLIWCSNNQSDVGPTRLNAASNPLHKLPSEDFEKTLFQLGKVDLLIVADELCVEDIKNNKVSFSIGTLLQHRKLLLALFALFENPLAPISM